MRNVAAAQIATLLDVSRMKEVLAERVFAGNPVSSCRILHARYKPGRTWIVSYGITQAGVENERIVYLRACERRGSTARYEKARALNQNVHHLPDLDSVAWVFPSDRKIAGLHALCAAKRLRTCVLPELVRAAYGRGWAVKQCSDEIVHYLPERSCMIRLLVTLTRPNSPHTFSAAFYGKAYPDEQGAETFRYMSELSNTADRCGSEICVARPLLYERDHAILWQLGVDGVRLNERAFDQLDNAGAALAALHVSNVSGLPAHPHTTDRLAQAAEVIADAAPDQREVLTTLLHRLQGMHSHLTKRPVVTLHGDLHPKNFILTRTCAALIDLDTLAVGDPMEDLASFAAALYGAGQAEGVAGENTRQRVMTFVTAYERASGRPLPEVDLNWHVAAALITERALRSVTRMKPDLLSPEALLDAAAQFVNAAERAMRHAEALV